MVLLFSNSSYFGSALSVQPVDPRNKGELVLEEQKGAWQPNFKMDVADNLIGKLFESHELAINTSTQKLLVDRQSESEGRSERRKLFMKRSRFKSATVLSVVES